MPRPQPLHNITSARSYPYDTQALTPRTPHSRSGRAEEAYTEVELQQIREGDHAEVDEDEEYSALNHQSVPLLSSSASDSFPPEAHRSRRTEREEYGRDEMEEHVKSFMGWQKELDMKTIASRVPVVIGMMLAGLLLFLVMVAYSRPGELERYIGVDESRNSSSSSTPSNHSSNVVAHPELVISYENYTKFPLHPDEYRAECNKLNKGFMKHGSYWEPHAMGTMDVIHPDGDKSVCTSTITYMLSGQVGLLADLALMAQAAALARERNRTFLVDDTYWDRGKWTDHFEDVRSLETGPEPGCKAPPAEELVACPRLARHWVINSRTAKFHLGHAFSNDYEDAYGHQLNRLKPIFQAASDSFHKTIRPNARVAALISSARGELSRKISASYPSLSNHPSDESTDGADPRYIAVHIRRGDRMPSSYNYHGGYVPLADFTAAVTSTWDRLHPEATTQQGPIVYLASDTPSALSELDEAFGADVFSLVKSENADLRVLASPADYFQNEFDESTEEYRNRATTGMVVDFALLSGSWASETDLVPDAVVCTLSSVVCKAAAIGLGWERAFGKVNSMGQMEKERKGWIEIDEKGQVVPEWGAFALFN